MDMPPPAAEPQIVYVCEAQTQAIPPGWRFVPSDKKRDEQEFVASEGSYASKGGRLEGPATPCVADPFAFYKLTFRSNFDEPGYYAVMFRDAEGKTQVDDIYGGVDPSTQWADQEFCFRGRENAKDFHLQFISHGTVAVRDIRVDQVSLQDAAAWADRLYAQLPALNYVAPAQRHRRLPKTMQKLHEGKTLRVVMLGDSIINDTNNSNWDALVGRMYPNCRIEVITSVRGSTGCWYYREDEHFKSYVLDKRPELLIIGGISHKQDIDAIRQVILKTQEATDCEILLMSGPVGEDWRPQDPANPDAPIAPLEYAGDLFNTELAKLADETGVAYFDMNTAWHDYLGASGKRWRWFHRDRVHANDRGKQILARLMERYFAPAAETAEMK